LDGRTAKIHRFPGIVKKILGTTAADLIAGAPKTASLIGPSGYRKDFKLLSVKASCRLNEHFIVEAVDVLYM